MTHWLMLLTRIFVKEIYYLLDQDYRIVENGWKMIR